MDPLPRTRNRFLQPLLVLTPDFNRIVVRVTGLYQQKGIDADADDARQEERVAVVLTNNGLIKSLEDAVTARNDNDIFVDVLGLSSGDCC